MMLLKLIRHNLVYGAKFMVFILVLQLGFAWLKVYGDSELWLLYNILFFVPGFMFIIHLLHLFTDQIFGDLRFMLFSFPISSNVLLLSKLMSAILRMSTFLLFLFFSYLWAFEATMPLSGFGFVRNSLELTILGFFLLLIIALNMLLFLSVFLNTVYKGPFKPFIGFLILIFILAGTSFLANILPSILHLESRLISLLITSVLLHFLSVKMLNEKLELL